MEISDHMEAVEGSIEVLSDGVRSPYNLRTCSFKGTGILGEMVSKVIGHRIGSGGAWILPGKLI